MNLTVRSHLVRRTGSGGTLSFGDTSCGIFAVIRTVRQYGRSICASAPSVIETTARDSPTASGISRVFMLWGRSGFGKGVHQ